MRVSLATTTFALACGQDVFLSKDATSAGCTGDGGDPYATGAEVPCCDGLEKVLKDWNGNGKWGYRCTASPSPPPSPPPPSPPPPTPVPTPVPTPPQPTPASKHDCVKQCLDLDEDENFHDCNHDGSNSCATSKCCEQEGYTCFMKNAYWSACAKVCRTGIPDFTGETWDCTALSPSSCASLQSCVGGCWGSESEETTTDVALRTGATMDWDCSAYTDKEDCLAHHSNFVDDALNELWETICNDNCPDAPEKMCPKSSFTECIDSCGDESLAPEHGDECEYDGGTNCLHSRCCQNPSDKCYTKNPYWAACTSSCTPGEPNPLDNQIWDCVEQTPRTTCDPYLYRSCVGTCWSQC